MHNAHVSLIISIAQVLSCALYESRQLGPMLHEPSLRCLLTMEERLARDALYAPDECS